MVRSVGILLIVGAVGICVLGSIFLVVGYVDGNLELSGAILGLLLLLIVVVAPLGGGGIVVLMRGRSGEQERQAADNLRKVLDMVTARGRVPVADIVVELGSDLPSVRDMIYRLVGMQVFSGYVNWDEGVLYSAEAGKLREMTECKHCGGRLTLAGKGVIKCPFCSTEYFV